MRATEVKKGHIYFGYQGNPKGIKIELLSKKPAEFKSKLVFENELDSLSYWFTPQKDSLQFKVTYNKRVDTVTVKLRAKEIDSLLVTNEIRGTLNLLDTFAIATNIPIDKIDKSKIKIIDKDSSDVPFTTFLDKSKKKLKLNFKKKYNNRYQFELLPNAIEDLFGNVNDSLNFNTSTKHPDDYGVINLTVHNVESYPIIVDVLDTDFKLIRSVYATDKNVFKFEFLEPDKYLFRVIYDVNKNKKWDAGNFLKRKKSETIFYSKNPVEIKGNWIEIKDFYLK